MGTTPFVFRNVNLNVKRGEFGSYEVKDLVFDVTQFDTKSINGRPIAHRVKGNAKLNLSFTGSMDGKLSATILIDASTFSGMYGNTDDYEFKLNHNGYQIECKLRLDESGARNGRIVGFVEVTKL
jgi:hypothetical protein